MVDEVAATETPTPEAEAAPVLAVEASPLGVQEETPAGEASTSGTETAAEGETKVEGEEAPDALTPESYEFKLPDGVTVDETAMASLKQTLATSKVAPEVAQSLLDLHVAELNKSAEAFATAQAAAWTSTLDGWKAAVSADPELGGANKAAVTSAIATALDEYGSLEARQAFDLTGVGWNPAVIKFIYKMSKALSEGTQHPANGPSSNRTRAPADVLYPPKET